MSKQPDQLSAINPVAETLSAERTRELAALPTLDEVFLEHVPTKQGHNYNPLYERHFAAHRLDVRRVLEIGVEAGTSLRFWRDYFPAAEIIGFDINELCREHEEERIRVFIGDQNKQEDLARLPGDIDIVIDDGLHTQVSQIETFRYLFREKMAARGIYVIEDIVGGMKTLEFVNRMSLLHNIWPAHLPGSKWSSFDAGSDFGDTLKEYPEEEQYYILNVVGVAIYRHIAFIDKARNPEDGQAAFRLHHRDVLQRVGEVRGEWLKKHGLG
ncbi:MAG: hypothetical protein RLW61_09455 [Gammaproteobacteria bacterium]